jgi:hypothetical protein
LTKWRIRASLRAPVGGCVLARRAVADDYRRDVRAGVLPLIAQAFRLALSGRYVSQTYFWRSAPRGVDALAPLVGNPFHPMYGGAVSALYANLGLDRIEAVGWLGIVPDRGALDGTRHVVRRGGSAPVEGGSLPCSPSGRSGRF